MKHCRTISRAALDWGLDTTTSSLTAILAFVVQVVTAIVGVKGTQETAS